MVHATDYEIYVSKYLLCPAGPPVPGSIYYVDNLSPKSKILIKTRSMVKTLVSVVHLSEVLNSRNKKMGQQSGFQKVQKILLFVCYPIL